MLSDQSLHVDILYHWYLDQIDHSTMNKDQITIDHHPMCSPLFCLQPESLALGLGALRAAQPNKHYKQRIQARSIIETIKIGHNKTTIKIAIYQKSNKEYTSKQQKGCLDPSLRNGAAWLAFATDQSSRLARTALTTADADDSGLQAQKALEERFKRCLRAQVFIHHVNLKKNKAVTTTNKNRTITRTTTRRRARTRTITKRTRRISW